MRRKAWRRSAGRRRARGACAAAVASLALLASCASLEFSTPIETASIGRDGGRVAPHRMGFREASALVCANGRPSAFSGSLRGWSFSAPIEAFASATLDVGRIFARAAERGSNRDGRLDAAARERVIAEATGPRTTLGCPENPAPVSRLVLRTSEGGFAALVADDAATSAREARRRRAAETIASVVERCPRTGGGDRICLVGGGASATPLLIAEGAGDETRSAVCATEAAFVCEIVTSVERGVTLLHQFDATRTSLTDARLEGRRVAEAVRALLRPGSGG